MPRWNELDWAKLKLVTHFCVIYLKWQRSCVKDADLWGTTLLCFALLSLFQSVIASSRKSMIDAIFDANFSTRKCIEKEEKMLRKSIEIASTWRIVRSLWMNRCKVFFLHFDVGGDLENFREASTFVWLSFLNPHSRLIRILSNHKMDEKLPRILKAFE